ncbi:MAG: aspartate aminotransferase [bacterium]
MATSFFIKNNMLEINKDISQLKPSATLLINEAVKKLRIDGEKIYHFGFGQSPFPIPNKIVKRLKKNADCNHYLPTVGLQELRVEIAKFLGTHQQIKTNYENIFIGPGSKELLYQTILILEGTYLIPKGSWVSYVPQVKSVGKGYNILETKVETNYKLQSEVLENYCKNNNSQNNILILNSPNNPSGAVYSKEEIEKLAEVCKKYNITVLSDEIYSQISFESSNAPSISNYYPEKTIVFGGLSKVFSAGGYRLGYMMLPNELKELSTIYQSLFSETFSAVSAPIQYAAIEAYKYKKSVRKPVGASVKILSAVGEYVYQNLTQAGVSCTNPQGGFYVLIGFDSFKEELRERQLTNSVDLANYLLKEFKIALLPGVDFYFSPEELIFRLAYVDFNGKKVLKKYLKNDVPLNSKFIETNVPNVVAGIQKIIEFVNTLSAP